MRDTIAGIATALGEGGIAIVRISGDAAIPIFTQTFRAHRQSTPYDSHRLMYGHVLDASGTPIDEAMGVVMRAPHS